MGKSLGTRRFMNPLKQKIGLVLSIVAGLMVYPALAIIWVTYGAKLALCLIAIMLGLLIQTASNKLKE